MSLVQLPTDTAEDIDLTSTSIDDLVACANAEYRLLVESSDVATHHLSEALRHGVAAGKALLECKARHVSGNWMEWLETAPLEFSVSQAHRYMRWAFYSDEIDKAEQPLDVVSVVQFLKPLPQIPRADRRKTKPRSLTDAEISEMKAVYEKGNLTLAEVGELFNCSQTTVCRYVSPGQLEKRQEYARRKNRQRRQEREAFKKQEKADAIRKAGGNISAAYSYVRKAAAELDAALADATSPEVRTALRAALSGVHKAEDEIGNAVRRG